MRNGGSNPHDHSGRGLVANLPGLIFAPLVVALGAVFVALRLRESQHSRAWAAGIWIGIGVAILLNGLCWVAITGIRFGG
jgi:hypothetical protein